MRVSIDKKRCAGTGLCAEICPNVFGVSSDYTVFLKEEGVEVEVEDSQAVVAPTEFSNSVKEAAELCPTDTIMVDK